ncbi:hypothetical protein WMY93_025889 [Mugilogobius chulae]|uniref:Uncharacterized protein n=1 Tax=Mugilogobius chulae TaxID=88201 RepID=A0AAW0N0G1_9GOBI
MERRRAPYVNVLVDYNLATPSQSSKSSIERNFMNKKNGRKSCMNNVTFNFYSLCTVEWLSIGFPLTHWTITMHTME